MVPRYKVLITDQITDKGIEVLVEAGLDVIYKPNSSISDKIKLSKNIHAWIVRSGTQLKSDLIIGAKKLQVIGRAGVGTDNIDITEATRNGVVVMNTPDVNTISAAEHTIALLLASSRNIPTGDASIKKGKWDRNNLVGTEVNNKILGVVGLGKIGREVIHRAKSFGMNIVGYDPYMSKDFFEEDYLEILDLDSLIKTSDFITLHIPLNNSTKNLFDLKKLRKMKTSARIINVARGGIINEADLAIALRKGIIAGAAIDVFSLEPLNVESNLISSPNIVLTPHLGASTQEAKEGVSIAICEQVRDLLINQKLSNALNTPFKDLEKLNAMKPFLDLSDILGIISSQLVVGPIMKIEIGCLGSISEVKPIALSYVKSLLSQRIPERINYINVENIVKELNIDLSFKYSTSEINFPNLINIKVLADNEVTLGGSVFDNKHPRLVNIMGFKMEVNPIKTMLFIENKDVPGVIGKIGSLLGDNDINIAAYLLSNNIKNGIAFAVLRLENNINDEIIKQLTSIEQIISLKQVNL